MIRTGLFTAAAAFCLVPAAMAHHDYYGSHNSYGSYGGYHAPQPTVSTGPCEKQKKNDQLTGGLIGAVAGGLIGVAIGGELEPDNGYHFKRGRRGYGRRGYRRGYYHSPGDDGAEIAGGLIGGLVGAAIGSELAGNSTDCARTYSTGTYGTRSYGVSSGDVYAPTRSPTGPAWENPQKQQSAAPQPASAPGPAYPEYPDYPNDDLYGGPAPEPYEPRCTTVRRETRLPDGTIIREPVEVCQTEDGRWKMPEDL